MQKIRLQDTTEFWGTKFQGRGGGHQKWNMPERDQGERRGKRIFSTVVRKLTLFIGILSMWLVREPVTNMKGFKVKALGMERWLSDSEPLLFLGPEFSIQHIFSGAHRCL